MYIRRLVTLFVYQTPCHTGGQIKLLKPRMNGRLRAVQLEISSTENERLREKERERRRVCLATLLVGRGSNKELHPVTTAN